MIPIVVTSRFICVSSARYVFVGQKCKIFRQMKYVRRNATEDGH